MADAADRLRAILRESRTLMRVLDGARELAPPDWLVVSGAVYQTVWNTLTGRPADHGIKDYDLFYFDPDPSWEAEDAVITRAAAHFPPDLSPRVEARNQARVHLWYPEKFGEPYAPLASTAEALTRFLAPAFAVGVRLESDGSLTVEAPFGLDDLFGMVLRPNPRRPSANFAPVAEGVRARWPEAMISPSA